ncbi:hypothetical protein ACJX0J_012169, partial [Zea mays]
AHDDTTQRVSGVGVEGITLYRAQGVAHARRLEILHVIKIKISILEIALRGKLQALVKMRLLYVYEMLLVQELLKGLMSKNVRVMGIEVLSVIGIVAILHKQSSLCTLMGGFCASIVLRLTSNNSPLTLVLSQTFIFCQLHDNHFFFGFLGYLNIHARETGRKSTTFVGWSFLGMSTIRDPLILWTHKVKMINQNIVHASPDLTHFIVFHKLAIVNSLRDKLYLCH